MTLTDPERATLLLIVAGRSNPEIARELHYAEDTIKTFVRTLFRILGARTRTQAVVRALQLGLIRLDEVPK